MSPTLFLMLGYPGAGKTTAATFIAKLTGAVHLSSDQIRLELFPKPTFSTQEHQQLYAAIDAKTKQLLSEGKSVIYDANLNRYIHRQEKYEICRQTGATPILVWLQVPKATAKERASHISRLHLWPNHESPERMFDRIAEVIEKPKDDEPCIALDGTKVDEVYVREKLQTTPGLTLP